MTERAERRRPLHLAVTLGVSAGMYASSLATVTALQANQDAVAVANAAPAAAALAAVRDANDRLTRGVDEAAVAFEAAGAGYRRVAAGLARTDARLGKLAASVASIEGVAVKLPASVPLPAFGPVRVVSAPIVNATTGASGAPK
jgi:hypothetical protein